MMIQNRFQFHLILKKFKGNATEIGVWKGNFSRYLLENCNFKKLYSIDPWNIKETEYREKWTQEKIEEAFQETQKTLKQFGSRSEIVRKKSEDAVELFPDCYFDFIYIDALHDKESVMKDMSIWWPKVKPKGIMAGHDYCFRDKEKEKSKEFGVIEAVNEFVKRNNKNLFLTKERFASWYIYKEDNLKLFN